MPKLDNPIKLNGIRKLASASKSCSTQSLAYGKCIGANYTDVSKGMCAEEFRAFKECVQKAMGKKW
ncbi:hypothetical protein FFLO_05556 [Filobasidium floriforme]|uniref:Uncharacterized protein n=2 Tax=Filobasidium floriforme TaxID=5210 RepID=A0A8K0JH47_9TREE|nr:hypothetical protein FFLO_05556 [Filobasidium floriforme]